MLCGFLKMSICEEPANERKIIRQQIAVVIQCEDVHGRSPNSGFLDTYKERRQFWKEISY